MYSISYLNSELRRLRALEDTRKAMERRALWYSIGSLVLIATFIALFMLALSAPAKAAQSRGLLDFLFAPPHHYRVHRHAYHPRTHRKAAPAPMTYPPKNSAPVDCARINEGIKELDPERLILALQRATEWQKQTIDRCAKEDKKK